MFESLLPPKYHWRAPADRMVWIVGAAQLLTRGSLFGGYAFSQAHSQARLAGNRAHFDSLPSSQPFAIPKEP